MDPARTLRAARRRAGLTQRQLAERTGVAQPTIARIERKREMPRADTLSALLRACGESLFSWPRLGVGIDRTLIREMLARTPQERLALLSGETAALAVLDRARPRR